MSSSSAQFRPATTTSSHHNVNVVRPEVSPANSWTTDSEFERNEDDDEHDLVRSTTTTATIDRSPSPIPMRLGSARERARYLDQLNDVAVGSSATEPERDQGERPSTQRTPPATSSHDQPSTSTTSPTATMTGQNTTRRSRGIQDLKSKTCWVCYEESSETPGREFVHACNCTLVAHTDCLLAWVTTDQIQKRAPAACPVCATRYIIVEDRSALLSYYKRLRRRWDSLSIVLAGTSVVAGSWFVAAAYGAWAIRTFAGQQVARALFLRHDKMPWRYWREQRRHYRYQATLILARTPLIDSLLPFLPLTLVLSTHSASARFSADPLGLDNLSLTYPPSPTLLACALPWIRILYLRARHRVFASVLGRQRTVLDGFAGMLAEMQAIDDGLDQLPAQPANEAGQNEEAPRRRRGGRFEVVAEVQVEEVVIGPDGQPAQPAPQADAAAGNGNGVVQNRLRVGVGRLTSLLVGALLFPALASLSGSALFWLAKKGGARPSSSLIKVLRKILGVQAVLAASYASKPATVGTAQAASNWLQKILLPTSDSIQIQSWSNPVVDPVWLRNALGGGLLLVARDAVELIAGLLEIRRKKSRRIMGRDFGEGLELDDGSSTATAEGAAGGSSGAGRDASGREARVHNLL